MPDGNTYPSLKVFGILVLKNSFYVVQNCAGSRLEPISSSAADGAHLKMNTNQQFCFLFNKGGG